MRHVISQGLGVENNLKTDVFIDGQCVDVGTESAAALISAAPEMLDALEEAIRLIATAEHQGAFDNCALPKIGQRTLNKLEALISRAKGE